MLGDILRTQQSSGPDIQAAQKSIIFHEAEDRVRSRVIIHDLLLIGHRKCIE